MQDRSGSFSDRNTLDNVSCHFLLPPVVKGGRPRIGVTGEILDVFEGDVLFQEVGNRRDAEGVGGEPGGEARVLHPPLDHATHVDRRHPGLREGLGPADGAPEERAVLRLAREARGLPVGEDEAFQVVPGGDLSALPVLLLEPERPLAAVVVEVLEVELGDGPDPDGRVDHDGDDGPVPEPDDGSDADGAEELPRLFDPDFGRLALDDMVAFGADGVGRVEDDGVADDQRVEELPHGGEVLLPGRGAAPVLIEILADHAGCDVHEVGPSGLAPREEAADGERVSLPRVLVPDFSLEELVPGESGGSSGLGDDGRGLRRARPGNCRGASRRDRQ